jgi:hypothetical protein
VTASAAHELLVPLEAIGSFLAEHGWTWPELERGALQMGGETLTVEAIESYLLLTDPVLWCEAFLVNRPEDGGGTWRLFDYQKPSMRWRGDVVHEDGAEVGKTREIIGLLLWGSVCCEGGQLIAGFEDGNLDEIWDEVEWQLGANPWLRSQLKDTWQKPYRKQEWKNGNRNVFRPAGHDGRAFRGIHVAQRAFFDEVAKVENPVTLSEFFRALKPFAEGRLYSVPDGRRGSPFYQLCERAVPHEAAAAARRPAPTAGDGSAAVEKRRRFTRFNWPKTLMPAPFWSPQREQEAIERYGGRDSSGFVRNVLGGWGDPEDTVFPWAKFSPCVRYVDEYRVAKILWDHATGTIYVDAWELSPGYELRAGSDIVDATRAAVRARCARSTARASPSATSRSSRSCASSSAASCSAATRSAASTSARARTRPRSASRASPASASASRCGCSSSTSATTSRRRRSASSTRCSPPTTAGASTPAASARRSRTRCAAARRPSLRRSPHRLRLQLEDRGARPLDRRPAARPRDRPRAPRHLQGARHPAPRARDAARRARGAVGPRLHPRLPLAHGAQAAERRARLLRPQRPRDRRQARRGPPPLPARARRRRCRRSLFAVPPNSRRDSAALGSAF